MKSGQSFILTYHSLDTSGSVISLPPETFRKQMEWLAKKQLPVVPLNQVREARGGIALTFDDGFRNFYQDAFPVLERHGFPATVFVISDYCGSRNQWPTQPRSTIPVLELMTWSEVEQVARAGVTIGCHTATHPHLTALSEHEIERELAVSKAAIEDRIGRGVDSLAYPYGETALHVREVVRRYFQLACSTRFAAVAPTADLLDLPRLDSYYFQNHFWFESLGSPHGSGYLAVRALLRGLRQQLRG